MSPPPRVPPGAEALSPHRAREIAESFGADAARYDRARPDYPQAMVRAIVAASPGPQMLEVGCGTGIAARQFEAAGCTVLGVDVDERTAQFARHRGLEVEVSTFEAWDPAGRSFDAVLAGQSWHWVDPVAGPIKAAQVLRATGRLAAFWNVFAAPPEVAEAFSAIYRRILPDWPRNPWARPALEGYAAILRKATDGIRASGAFSEVQRWRFDWERSYTAREWLEQMATSGDASQFAPAKLAELLAATGDVIEAWGGTVRMGYAAVVLTATRLPVS